VLSTTDYHLVLLLQHVKCNHHSNLLVEGAESIIVVISFLERPQPMRSDHTIFGLQRWWNDHTVLHITCVIEACLGSRATLCVEPELAYPSLLSWCSSLLKLGRGHGYSTDIFQLVSCPRWFSLNSDTLVSDFSVAYSSFKRTERIVIHRHKASTTEQRVDD
jgi:hypothetical protein